MSALAAGVPETTGDPVRASAAETTGDPVHPHAADITGDPVHPHAADITGDPVHPHVAQTTGDLVRPGVPETTGSPVHPSGLETTEDPAHPHVAETTGSPVHPSGPETTEDPVHPHVAETTGDPVRARVPARPGGGGTPGSWYPAAGLAQRGTVVLLPGRGEHPGVYERFGRRLAADAYVVHVLDVPEDRDDGAVAGAVDAVGAGAAEPLVLAGSDTGALRALAAAGRTAVPPAGLLLAGVPQPEAAGGWDDELSVRTACPTHRGRLDGDPLFVPGALASPVPAALSAAAEAALAAGPELPALVLHGAADPVSAPATGRALASRLPAATLATVTDGRHDVLNDIQHRSVAALVVQWLERLRLSPSLPPVLTVEPPRS
ncbi:alpha/beta hydrolase [Actinacidiphila alni]|uniref:alpha/beta hydrolase n=1 Tax=Actinacidiphila alni TaxID=380248 RepID=UPI0034099517